MGMSEFNVHAKKKHSLLTGAVAAGKIRGGHRRAAGANGPLIADTDGGLETVLHQAQILGVALFPAGLLGVESRLILQGRDLILDFRGAVGPVDFHPFA